MVFFQMRDIIKRKWGVHLYLSEVGNLHRLPGGSVIVEFAQRMKNSCFQAVLLKEPIDRNLNIRAEIRLCSYDRAIEDSVRQLKREKRVDFFYTDHISGRVTIKIGQKKIHIGSFDDLDNLRL